MQLLRASKYRRKQSTEAGFNQEKVFQIALYIVHICIILHIIGGGKCDASANGVFVCYYVQQNLALYMSEPSFKRKLLHAHISENARYRHPTSQEKNKPHNLKGKWIPIRRPQNTMDVEAKTMNIHACINRQADAKPCRREISKDLNLNQPSIFL